MGAVLEVAVRGEIGRWNSVYEALRFERFALSLPYEETMRLLLWRHRFEAAVKLLSSHVLKRTNKRFRRWPSSRVP
jgi:hypothetical protein